jgi:hypothetical protein
VITVQRTTVTVYQGSGATINVTISNRGFTFDNINLRLDGDVLLRTDMEVVIGKNQIEVAPGSSTNTTLHVDASENARPGFYSVNLTATSLDGLSTYTRALSIRIVDPDDLPDIGPEDEGDQETSDTQVLMIIFVLLLLLVIMAMGYAYYRMDRRERIQEVEVVPAKKKGMQPGKDKDALKEGKKGKRELPPGK